MANSAAQDGQASDENDELELVSFHFASQIFALEAAAVRALHQQPPTAHCVDLESLLGLGEPSTRPRQWLSLHAAPALGLALPAPARLLSIKTGCIHRLPALLAQHCQLPGLCALAQCEAASPPLLLLALDAELLAGKHSA